MKPQMDTDETQMGQREWNWIIGWGLVLTKYRDVEWLTKETHLNLPVKMHTCGKCRVKYYSICPNCTYRNGGQIHDEQEPYEEDLYDGLQKLRSDPGYRLEAILRWMRVA